MLSKNAAKGKEKSKDSLKTKHERRPSQSTKDQHNVAEDATMQAISPRTLVIDFPESTNDAHDRKLEQLIGSNGNSKSPRNRIKLPSTSSRETSKLFDVVKNLDSSRRHASCGPRLMSVVAAAIDDLNTKENNPKLKHSSDIKCIGNKCGPENTDLNNNNQIASTRTSPRKASLDTPGTAAGHTRPRLKPLNALSKTNNVAFSASNRSEIQTMTSTSALAPANITEYRKYLTQSYLNLNKLPSKLPINDHYYNSHFLAVGLSLRAWRSKYGRIRNNREGQNGSSNSSMIETKPKPANSTRKTIKTIMQ